MKINREEKFWEGDENTVIVAVALYARYTNCPEQFRSIPPPISILIDSGSFFCSSRTVTR